MVLGGPRRATRKCVAPSTCFMGCSARAFCSRLFITGRTSYLSSRLSVARVEDHLRAAEERELFAALRIGDGSVPHLRGAPAVGELRLALNDAFVFRAEEVALQLYRGEAFGALGQVHEAAVATGGVGKRDYRGGVQVA